VKPDYREKVLAWSRARRHDPLRASREVLEWKGSLAMSGTHNGGKTVVSGGSTTGSTVQVSTNGSPQGSGIRNGDGTVSIHGTTIKPNGMS
jgi:hypothetical protein